MGRKGRTFGIAMLPSPLAQAVRSELSIYTMESLTVSSSQSHHVAEHFMALNQSFNRARAVTLLTFGTGSRL